MMTKEHERKNKITDTDTRGIYANPILGMAYEGIQPNTHGKICGILFILICDNIRYKSGKTRDGYDFISNITPITIDTILLNAKSASYAEGKKIQGDRRNFRNYLKDIHDNNIFYMWECGGFYIFILEREIRSWKFYNSEGFVTPKTMIKIICRSRSMINDMIGFHAKTGRYLKSSDIESSFGIFINKMIAKMHPLISVENLPKWEKNMHIYAYLDNLRSQLENLQKFDGLSESSDYKNRLPIYIRNYLDRNNEGECYMNDDMEKEIAPTGKGANIGKTIRNKKIKESVKKEGDVPVEDGRPKKSRFDKSVDPFEDGPSFTKFYRAYLQQIHGNTNIYFEDIQADNRSAVEILDLLRENNLSNRDFLIAWIKYFYNNELKGEKVRKVKYTALSVFRYTFERYKESHYIPQ